MMYQGFAAVYDMFMDNIPYDKWARYISKLLKEEGISDGNVVELGCGTGNITRELAKRGYTMTGIDISTEMLSIAAGKPDIQHRTDWDSASVFFPVVETKSAIAVSPGVFVWAAFSASAALYAAGRTFHHRLHTVEGWGIGKIHFVSSFS